ncbi:hypothetical protein B1806_15360 [Metallibacterium scheffleri]|uniref:Uncharacterized protein n=1 Tax=Metallibacterium scheffleri TaxID=993689 RepID=A0A4S3KF36_9GAMM|nr:hypothetical protein B1806_15360 [Metallibacterium scheffleri]
MNGGDRWRAAGAMTADTAQCSAGITLARVAQCDPKQTLLDEMKLGSSRWLLACELAFFETFAMSNGTKVGS